MNHSQFSMDHLFHDDGISPPPPLVTNWASMESYRRQLFCLKYPCSESIDLSCVTDYRSLVVWLEDRKIRRYTKEDRGPLSVKSETWDTAFSGYLTELDCPFCFSGGSIDCIIWLIGHAVAVDYEFLELNAGDSSSGMVVIDNVELPTCNSEIDRVGIDSIGSALKLPRTEQENDSEYLERLSRMISLVLSPGCLEALQTNNIGGIPLQEFPLGFNTGDENINQIATVLKMLYLSDFREMQNDLNALIELGQNYTANPRMNNSLGKVGR